MNDMADPGASSAGRKITEQPAAIAGAIFLLQEPLGNST